MTRARRGAARASTCSASTARRRTRARKLEAWLTAQRADTQRVDELVVHQPADARDAEPGDEPCLGVERDDIRTHHLRTQPFSRRRFLQDSAVGAGVVAVSPYLVEARRRSRRRPSPTTRASSSRSTSRGGNDGLNMVVPVRRPALRRAAADAARSPTATRSAAGSRCTRRCAKLKARFDQGKVAVVRGVGYKPPDLSHFSSSDIWMHGWGGARHADDRLGSAASSTASRTPTHESLYGVVVARRRERAPRGRRRRTPSSLPLNIGDAFGIDRTDSVRRAHVRRAHRAWAPARPGSARSATSTTQTEMELMQLDAADPARVRLRRPADRHRSSSSCSPRTSSTPTSASA